MDLAGPAAAGRALICVCLLLTCLASAQTGTIDEQARQLLAQQKWNDVVRLAQSVSVHSADLDFSYGSALAQLQQWGEAHRAFEAGATLQPRDPRFLVEMAGVDFKQKRYTATVSHLRRALRLAPGDAYANDFLATTYFLQGNQEAAVKYWNRVGKPRLAAIRFDPTPHVNPALLDRAFAFAPATVLQFDDLLSSEARVKGLGIFSSFGFEPQARADGGFDLVFHNHEDNGFGPNRFAALLRVFQGLPGQTIYPEYYNYRNRAINLVSMFRWDAEKRRAIVEVSEPVHGNPRRRVAFGADLRSENWDIRPTSSDSVPTLANFNMRREAISAQITTFQNWRWDWTAGLELSHRDFRDINLGTVLVPDLLLKGYQLKQSARLDFRVLQIPEDRLTVSGTVFQDAGRIWSTPTHAFERVQGTARLHWLPQAVGDDYEFNQHFRAGKTWGDPPFDELYVLGGLGDNILMMRGHITTHRGRKGSGPIGRNYFVSNSEVDKNIFRNAWIGLKVGPFLDTGTISDPLPGLGAHKWLWDTGGQFKVTALGVGVSITYGKDLRSGNNALFVTLLGK